MAEKSVAAQWSMTAVGALLAVVGTLALSSLSRTQVDTRLMQESQTRLQLVLERQDVLLATLLSQIADHEVRVRTLENWRRLNTQ